MPKEKLIELLPGKGLDSGVFPSAEPTAGAVWYSATNAWFRSLHIEAVPGRERIVSSISRSAKVLAQAYVNGLPRLYYEDLGVISYYEDGATQLVGALNADGSYSLEPYGTWLLASDNMSTLQLWKGTGSFAAAGDVASQFATAKIIKKLAQHVLAYNTDTLPTGFHWCSASNPEVWTPSTTNSAGNLPIRDLDSDIIGVADLGAAHGVYSGDYMLVVQYVGAGNWFGTPNQALKGIGAVSKDSTVPVGKHNWGMSRGGIFVTDGNSFTYPDRPAVDRWLQENVDWSRADEVVGYFNDQLQLVVWTVPLNTGGITTIAVEPHTRTMFTGNGGPTNRAFTFLSEAAAFGTERVVFNYPIIAKSDGIYFNSVTGTVDTGFALATHLFHAGMKNQAKIWDHVILEGTLSGQVRVGFCDVPQRDLIEWNDWQDMEYHVYFKGRESIFLALEFRSDEAIRLSGITVYGDAAGFEA